MNQPIVSSVVRNSVQIVNEISPYITDFNYEDILKAGVSKIVLGITPYNNRPVLGDFLEIRIRYLGDILFLNTGTHRIDDIQYRFGEDRISIGAVSWDYQLGLKEVGKGVFSNTNLSIIVSSIANEFNLTVGGVVSSNKAGTSESGTGLVSESYEDESKLDFLANLAIKYGYAFNLKFGILVFQSIETLRNDTSIKTITASDIIAGSRFRESVYNTFRFIRVKHKNGTIVLTDTSIPGDDELDLRDEGFYENFASAVMRAKGAAYQFNTRRITGQISLYGDSIYSAGANITITGLGTPIDGKFNIEKVNTNLTPNGWITTLDITAIYDNQFSIASA